MKHPTLRLAHLFVLLALVSLILVLPSCGEKKPPVERNAVTGVTVKDGEITVSAVLTEGFLQNNGKEKIHLIELPSHAPVVGELTGVTPIASEKPRDEMTFQVSARDGLRSRMYSAFLLATYDEAAGTYTALTAPVSATAIQTEATVPAVEAPTVSIKGLISDHPADAIRLGIAHTVVDVSIDALLLDAWDEDAVAYVSGGVTAYLDGNALSALDATVNAYASAGVQVFLRFGLSGISEACRDLGLYFEDAIAEGHAPAAGYAVNLSSARAATAMEGFFAFMADRYASPDDDVLPVTAFILGYRVNDNTTYAVGHTGHDAFITNYEKLVHIAHIALRTHNASGRVYISLDSRRAAGADGGWDIPAFLSAFRDEADLRGDYDWNVACELYAPTDSVWIENTAAEAEHYTIRNLGSLSDILTGETYLTASGAYRRLLISGFSIPAVGLGETASDERATNQAASYIFAYLSVLENAHIEALIYDCYADPAATAESTPLCGLLTSAKEGEALVVAAQRPLYTIFKQADTTEASGLSSQLTAVIGAPYTKLAGSLVGIDPPITTLAGTTKLTTATDLDRPKRATSVISFTGGSFSDVKGSGNHLYSELIAAKRTEDGTPVSVALHSRFERISDSEPMTLTFTRSASSMLGADNMLVYLRTTGASDDISLTLRLSRAAKGTGASGVGMLVYETKVEGIGSEFTSASFDVTDFTNRIEAEDEITISLILEADEGLSHDIDLAGVYVTNAKTRSPIDLGALLLIVVIILAIIAACVIVMWILRTRSRRADRRSHNEPSETVTHTVNTETIRPAPIQETPSKASRKSSNQESAKSSVKEPIEVPEEEPVKEPITEPIEDSFEEPIDYLAEEPADLPAESSVEEPNTPVEDVLNIDDDPALPIK